MNFASDYVLVKKRSPRSRSASKPSAGTSSTANLLDFVPVDESDLDTNIISTRFGNLVEFAYAHAGDPYTCRMCDAVLSKLSELGHRDPITGKRTWKCDFCNFEEKFSIENEELPCQEETTYILEAAAEKSSQEVSTAEVKYLMYCIDVSGSMSITTPVTGNFQLPTDKIRRQALITATGEPQQIYSPRSLLSPIRQISRLEAVQVAIEDNLYRLEKTDPEKKVGLVSFNQNVSVIGDGKINKIKIASEVLES